MKNDIKPDDKKFKMENEHYKEKSKEIKFDNTTMIRASEKFGSLVAISSNRNIAELHLDMYRLKTVQPSEKFIKMSSKSSKQNNNRFELLNSLEENEMRYKERKNFKTYNQPKAKLENNEDYVNLKNSRKQMKNAIEDLKNKNEMELIQQASAAQTAMNEQYALARWSKVEKQQAEAADKEKSRQHYLERQLKKKLENRGHLLPLDPLNDINNNQRLLYYSRNHRCVHNKKFDMINMISGQYKVRCTHFETKTIRIERDSIYKCMSCGVNSFTICKNKCGCRVRCCNRCFTNNYVYKNIHLPGSETIIESVHQMYDCHFPDSTDVRFTVQEDDHIELVGGEDTLVPGKIFDIYFTDPSVQRTEFEPKVEREKFLNALKTDKFNKDGSISTFTSYAEKLAGKLKTVESEEQGGAVSAIATSAVAAKDKVFDTLMESLYKVLIYCSDIPEKLKTLGMAAEALKSATKFLDILCYYLGIIWDHMTFTSTVTTVKLLVDVIGKKSITSGSLDLLVLIAELSTQESIALNNLAKFEHPTKYWHAISKGTEDEDVNKVAGPFRTILNKMLRTKILYFCEDFEMFNEGREMKLNKKGLEKIRKQSFLSYLISGREESGGWTIDCVFQTIKEKAGLIYEYADIKKFCKFLKEIMPLLTAANLASNICPKICNVITRWIFGNTTNEAWLDEQIHDNESPIHKLLTIYLAYQSSTVSSKVLSDEHDSAKLRAEFYQLKVDAQEYVAKEKRWCNKFVQFISFLEKGMSTPPQPTDRKFEPTLLVLFGIPGVGKSTIWPFIVGSIMGMSAQEVRKTTYTWNNSSEYQTGMVGKKVILYDDYGQDRTDNQETLSLIHMCTSAPYAINSANIVGQEIKGLFATPDLVVVCTNDKDLATDKVFSKNAVLRRVDLGLELVKRLDLSDASTVSAQKVFNIRHCTRNGTLIGKSANLYEITTLLDMIHTNKRADYEDVKNNMEVRMENVSMEILASLTEAVDSPQEAFFSNDKNLVDDYNRYKMIKSEKTKALEKKQEEKSKIMTNEKGTPPIKEEPMTSESSKRVKSFFGYWKENSPQVKAAKKISDLSDFSVSKGDSEQSGFSVETLKHYCSCALKMYLLDTVDIILPAYVIASLAAFVSLGYQYEVGGNVSLKKVIFSGLRTVLYSVGAAFAAFGIYSALFKNNDKEESGTTKTAKPAQQTLSVNSRQEGGDAFENVSTVFKKASGTLVSENGRTINCLAIGGHWLLIPNHFFYDLEAKDHLIREGVEVVLKMAYLPTLIHFDFRRENLRQIMNYNEKFFDGRPVRTDVILYKVNNKTMPAMKNIIKHFWDGEYDTTGMEVAKIDFMVNHTYTSESMKFTENIHFDATHEFEVTHGKVTYDRICTYRDKGKDHYCHIVAEATYKPRVRSCGSVVLRTDGIVKPALGIHVAATQSNKSLFHFVTAQELIMATKEAMIDVEQSGFINYESEQGKNDLPEYHQFMYVGTTDRKHTTFQPLKTDLQPSLVYETFGEHKTEPSLLSNKDPRIPEDKRKEFWTTMMEGYKNVSTFAWEDIQEATESIIEDNRRAYKEYNIKPRVLNDVEVLNGTVEWPSIGRVPMDTSCGWPYNCEGKKKKDLIEDDGTTLYFKQRLREDFNNAENLLNNGIKPCLPFTTTIKDERLPLRKIYQKPKSRLFMAGNLIHFLICRKYFSHAMELAYVNKKGYAAYMDRISLDWHEYISRMTEVGNKGSDGDFEFYDRMINRALLYGMFLINVDGLVRQGVLQPESKKYLALQELICAPEIIFGNQVYMALGILCSGCLLTYKGNCDMNEIMQRSAYLSIMRQLDPRLGTIQQYKKNVRGMRGGDDTMDIIADNIIDHYNGVSISMWFQQHNVRYTSANKIGEIVPHKPFKELSFLKNTTGVMHGYYVPLGDMDSLIESMYWVRLNKNNKDIVKATEDNVNASLRAIYFYGQETFDRMRKKLIEKEPRLNLLTFKELNIIWDKYGYFPGSHSDYATKNDQELSLTTDPEDKFKKYGLRVDDTTTKMLNVQSYEESGITGKDTASMSVEMNHPMVGLDEHITTIPENETPADSMNQNDGSQSNVNGAFIESKEQAIKKSVKIGRIPITSADFRAQGHINDKNWTLAKLASKFTSLGQVNWDISQTPGTILKHWNLPNDILITPALRTPFDVTAYERFKSIRFKVTTSASPFYAGRLIMGFVPFFDKLDYKDPNIHLSLTQLGGIVINPVENQTYEMSIPYRHYLDWLEYPQDCMGQFYIAVQNQLRTGADNVNSIAVSVFVSIEGAEFKVPEYVTNPTKSMKVVMSRPQGDDGDDTSITISKHVSSINENFQDNVTMMCAGTGVYQEPRIKQFPDHPHDLVQLLKRDRPFITATAPVPAFGGTVPGITTLHWDLNNIYGFVTGRYGVLYELYRGSLVIRGDFFGVKKDNGPLRWVGKAYVLNDVTTDPGTNLMQIQEKNDVNLGYHKFDELNPPSFSIPFWCPNFVARARGEFIPYQTPMGALVIELYNYDAEPIDIRFSIEVRVDDDFAMGCFAGMPGLTDKTKKTDKKSESWYFPRIFSREQGGETQGKINGMLDGMRNGARTLGQHGKKAMEVIDKTQKFIEIAEENMEPVMEIADMIGSLLDAPPITLQPTPVMPRKWNYGTPNNILQYVEKLGNTNHNGASYSDSSSFGTNTLETNIYHLIQNIKTLQDTVVWSSDDAAGKILAKWNVGPTRDGNANKVASPLDYFARDFNYWAGSLIYGIDVVTSQMHTGRLVLTYHPNLNSTEGLTLDMATQQYFLSFDVDKGKGCSIVAAPYLYKMPYRTVAEMTKGGGTAYKAEYSYNGIMVLWVMNPLRSSPTVSKTVDINIYKMGGKDFRFAAYGSILNSNLD